MHVDDALHDRIRRHCVKHDVQMKQWVGAVLVAALEGDERKPIVPVRKKLLAEPMQETGDEPWSRPPFWAKA